MTPEQRELYGHTFETFPTALNGMQGSGLDAGSAARPLNLDLRPRAELLTYFGPESAAFLRISQRESRLTCEA